MTSGPLKSSKPSPSKAISDTELAVLKVLWDIGAASVRNVQHVLEEQGHEWAYTTVQTLLQRLETKRYATVSKAEVPHKFEPAVNREGLLDHQLSEMAMKVCDGIATPLVLNLVQNQKFTSEEIKHFRKLLDELEENKKHK